MVPNGPGLTNDEFGLFGSAVEDGWLVKIDVVSRLGAVVFTNVGEQRAVLWRVEKDGAVFAHAVVHGHGRLSDASVRTKVVCRGFTGQRIDNVGD